MLFDLQGKRRRVVQATYLTLAVLMGGGLVFFGIGGDVSGGLFDAFSERGGGGGSGDEVIEKRIERNQERLRRNPRDEAALKDQVRANFQLATGQGTPQQVGFPPEARDELEAAARAWERYAAVAGERLDPSLAAVALQVFDVTALNRPKEAQEVAAVIAQSRNNAAAYLQLVQYAALAGDTRAADLAGQRAVDLAPADQRRQVKQQVDQIKAQVRAQAAQGAAGGQSGAGAPSGGSLPD